MPVIKLTLEDLREFYYSLNKKTVKKLSQESFIRTILGGSSEEDKLLDILMPRGNSITRPTLSRLYRGESTPIYKKTGEYLAKVGFTDDNFCYETCSIRKKIQRNWKVLLQSGWLDLNIDLETKTDQLLRRLPDELASRPKERLQYLLDSASSSAEARLDTLTEVLSSLTLICLTRSYWEEEDMEDMTFDHIWRQVLPRDRRDIWDAAWSLDKDMNQEASEELEKAENMYRQIGDGEIEDQKTAERVARNIYLTCRRIFGYDQFNVRKYRRLSTDILGHAAYLLYECIRDEIVHPGMGESASQYLEYSFNCGYGKAREKMKEMQAQALVSTRQRSLEGSSGICIFNSKNEYTNIISDTAPTSWKMITRLETRWDEGLLSHLDKERSFSLKPGQALKFILADENQQRNLQNTLAVLQAVKNINQNQKGESDSWQTEIYLRADEEWAGPLVDTAMSHMDGCVIPVYILDESKRAAQLLLYHHPLIYPLRDLQQDMKEKTRLNLVLIGGTECAEWIVRQAYWLLTFHEPCIQSGISILGPEAQEMKDRLLAKCPEAFREDSFLSAKNVREKEALYEFLKTECWEKEEPDISQRYYYIIDLGSDEENLTCAIRLREEIIRRIVGSKGFRDECIMPEGWTIAFHCKNADIALLAKTMVVQNETYGSQWFNNYGLLPFGIKDELYHFDNLNGGILEEMARCIHLQYCGISAGEDRTKKLDDNLKSYYLRYYDRDSSMAVAISLPYRLFQCWYEKYQEKHRILPSVIWNICDAKTFEDDTILSALAKEFREFAKNEIHVENLSKWEHVRWTKYMRSLGWRRATSEQTIAYIKAGNPRQQLYIARLHPCMCSYEDLQALEKDLNEFNEKLSPDKRRKTPFNFTNNDIKNIKETSNFLLRLWFHKNYREEEEK